MSYRIARSTLALTIIIITFAPSFDAQITDKTLSSAGKKFVIGFPRNSGQRADELFLFITNPESSAVNFTVSLINISGNVSNSSTRVNIPSSFEILSVNERNKGILVEADRDINLYGMSFHQYTADAYLALPCSKMAVDEYEYYGISYDIITSYHPSVILLVACENETVVEFNSSIITLNSMETYQIESDNDLTGTRITSSKPLSVFSGSDCAYIPRSINYCDHLVEQVPPTVTWGSKFFVASLEGRSSGECIRVLSARAASVAVNCNTNVSVSQFQLQSGGSFREFEIPINSFCSIESTSPVLVAQYAYSRDSDGVGDPFMMIISPIEQFTNNYYVEAFPLFVSNYVTVYVSSEFSQTAQILLDNSIVTGWRNVVCSSGEICGHISRTNVSTGVHSIRHQNSSAVLGVSVYGFGIANSYGYPGGMRLSPIQCNCGQNVNFSSYKEQFNCSCSNGFFASLSETDEVVCIAITCPPLTAPTNGFVTYSSSTSDENGNYAFNAMANHSCDTGFVLVGNNTRTCTGDGSSTTGVFNGEAAFCKRELIFKRYC
ncbi:IgGFc-binding protein-like [Halichondria panicea]|uniref:IgGFc-binding protein-like n=1 Tax=Halichondria panicea TaxID=6063 RepID=UPI00312B8E78